MVWRKRRRHRLASIVSYLCTVVGVVFIVGNVIMLREGFVQLYVTAFGEPTPSRREDLHHSRSYEHNRWRDSRYYPHLAEMDLPRVELPSSALAAELRLRKLMENGNSLGYRSHPLSVSKQIRYLDVEDRRYIQDRQIVAARPPHGVSVIAVTSRDLRQSLYVTSDCSGLQNLTDISVIGSGWTKVVYKVNYRDSTVALKTVDLAGHDLVTCTRENKDKTMAQCYELVVQKLLKEILLLRGLQNPHIVQVVAHCVPNIPFNGRRDSIVTMATELGDSIDIIKLLNMSWEDRLRISYGLSKLLHYLAHSPYGSVILTDFRRQQFVLTDGDLKLTDLDDMGFMEQPCLRDSDCQQYYSSANLTLKSPCVASQCLGLNEKKNIFNAARHFTTFLLPHGAPRPLRPAVDQLVDHFSKATKTSKQLLQDMTLVVDDYSTGAYLNLTGRHKTAYGTVAGRDVAGRYDYSCVHGMDGTGCVLSVYDQKEAEQLCDADTMCKAFVLTGAHTWTGRMEARLKSGYDNLSNNPRATLYIKPSL